MSARVRIRQRGYTAVEALIAITLLVLGVGGVASLQRFATTTNRSARQLSVATQVARTWMERLRTDALSWNHPSTQNPSTSDLADTTYMNLNGPGGSVTVLNFATGANAGWVRPNWNATLGWGAVADILGNDVAEDGAGTILDTTKPAFCTNYRMQFQLAPSYQRANVVRVEVRTFWPREAPRTFTGSTTFGPFPTVAAQAWAAANLASLNSDTALAYYRFVYVSSEIRQNQAQ